jgi:ABC-type uncharacterized transport system fused permease/ATPase subunit
MKKKKMKKKTKQNKTKQTNKQTTNQQKQINQAYQHRKTHKCPMMLFMMQIVEQMMTSLSLYALLHIKLNKYIKINIY